MDGEEIRAAAHDPDGRRVVLLERIWAGKILRDRPELRDHLEDVVLTVSAPNHVEPDPRPSRRRYYRHGIGPSRWFLVVVGYEQQPARIVTALANRKDPTQWNP